MRNHIKALIKGIDVVMLQPEFKSQVDLIIQMSFSEVYQIIDSLIKNHSISDYSISKELSELAQDLPLLQNTGKDLFEIRTDANKQYPSMEISSRIMRPVRNQVYTIIDNAIVEYKNDNPSYHNIIFYELLLAIRQSWTQTIAVYRLYLANRVGSFDEEQLLEQEEMVDEYIEQMFVLLAELKQHETFYGFESAQEIPKLKGLIQQWQNGYAKSKEINRSDSWRKDTELMMSSLLPLTENIENNIINIDKKIDEFGRNIMLDIITIGHWQNVLLLTIGIIFIVYSLVIFIFLKKLIFKPVIRLSELLQNHSIDSDSVELRELGRTKETKFLIDSFISMNNQVQKRQNELTHQALHDALTSLPNRKLLVERLHHDIDMAKRDKTPLSFLMLDLNGFKNVNDTLGHQVGDQLLIQVGERLQLLLREIDTIARLGGDEFSIILPHTNKVDASLVAKKINNTIEKDFIVGDCVLHISTSIGITEYPEYGDNVHDLMKHADVAMYISKKSKSEFNYYDPVNDDHSIERLSLTSDLKKAIENKWLDIYYQPKITVSDNSLSGYEVLLRWEHESCGFIPPDQIVEIAENSALIDDLSFLVFEKTLENHLQLSQIYQNLKPSVNLSVKNLRNDKFIERIEKIINDKKFSSDLITFELTESSMMEEPEKCIDILKRLTAIGFNISVDDFGTGFSSLLYLKKLPVSELKIDRSFVQDMIIDNNDFAIVKSTIEMAHSMGLNVVAEGVETEDSYHLLRKMKCNLCQGYYFSKPINFDDFNDWLTDYRNNL
ncbi:MAG: bifunctional diguanylate cyclase/phosphodiesterase [Gammaproteobacteria bacterium]|nr:bifunctional diguanylate cyclase/phosphodiesterase [Gammaproteobacteria bacterium]